MVVSQMWAFAADSFNVKSGQRLFVVIMLGANLGALAGAKLTQLLVAALSPIGPDGAGDGHPRRHAVARGARARGGAGGFARDLGRARPAGAAPAGRHRSGAARPLPAADRAARRAAQLDQHDRRVHPRRLRQGRCRGARCRERRRARPRHADHRVLRRLPVLGDAGQPRHPAVPGLAHLPGGRRARRAADPPGHRGGRATACWRWRRCSAASCRSSR